MAERTMSTTTTAMISANRVNPITKAAFIADGGGGARGHRSRAPSSCQVTGRVVPTVWQPASVVPRIMRPASSSRRSGLSILAGRAGASLRGRVPAQARCGFVVISAAPAQNFRASGCPGRGSDAPSWPESLVRVSSARAEHPVAGRDRGAPGGAPRSWKCWKKALTTPDYVEWDELPTRASAGAWCEFARWSSEPLSGQPPPGSQVVDYSVGPPPFSGADIVATAIAPARAPR
jgi:hypothetical protein